MAASEDNTQQPDDAQIMTQSIDSNTEDNTEEFDEYIKGRIMALETEEFPGGMTLDGEGAQQPGADASQNHKDEILRQEIGGIAVELNSFMDDLTKDAEKMTLNYENIVRDYQLQIETLQDKIKTLENDKKKLIDDLDQANTQLNIIRANPMREEERLQGDLRDVRNSHYGELQARKKLEKTNECLQLKLTAKDREVAIKNTLIITLETMLHLSGDDLASYGGD